MKRLSVPSKIAEAIDTLEKGTLISVQDFLDSVITKLSRMCTEGKLIRCSVDCIRRPIIMLF